MIRPFSLAFTAALAATVAACDALTSPVDVAATVGDQQLTVERLAGLMRRGSVPPNPEAARAVADLWVRYSLVAQSAARGDSVFTDSAAVIDAMWAMVDQARVRAFYDIVKRDFPRLDSARARALFDRGELFAARHILVPASREAPAAERDAARRKAEDLRRRATAENFAALARQYGSDGTKDQGGDLGVFGRGAMVPEFEQGVAALAPGEIGPVVETQFGFHVVRRSTFDEVADRATAQLAQRAEAAAESTYVADLEKASAVTLRPELPGLVKAAAENPDAKRDDRAVLATYKGGTFRVSDLVRWFGAFPPQAQVRQQLRTVPDSVTGIFVRNLIRNQLIIAQADSARIPLDTATDREARTYFRSAVEAAWAGLRVAPGMLADSAADASARRALAARRVDEFLDRLVANEAGYVDVPDPVVGVLRRTIPARVNEAAIVAVVGRVEALGRQADSAAKAAQPPSAVPIPAAGADTGRRP